MDIRYLESLIEVVEQGSIAQAARSLNLTAAALGQRIQFLERYFDTPLLDRSNHSASPTEACLNLLPRARVIVQQSRHLRSDIDQSGLSGAFSLGAISTALTGILPASIKKLSVTSPNLSLQIRPGASDALYTDLINRRVDAAILVLPPHPLPPFLASKIIREEALILISNDAIGNTVEEKLTSNPYISYDPKSWGGLKAQRYLVDRSIKINAYCELDALEAIEKLVKEKMGVSLVPKWLGLDLSSSDLTCTVINRRQYYRQVAFVFREDCGRPKVIEALIDTFGDI